MDPTHVHLWTGVDGVRKHVMCILTTSLVSWFEIVFWCALARFCRHFGFIFTFICFMMYCWWGILIACVVAYAPIRCYSLFRVVLLSFSLSFQYFSNSYCVSFSMLLDGVWLSRNKSITYLLTYLVTFLICITLGSLAILTGRGNRSRHKNNIKLLKCLYSNPYDYIQCRCWDIHVQTFWNANGDMTLGDYNAVVNVIVSTQMFLDQGPLSLPSLRGR